MNTVVSWLLKNDRTPSWMSVWMLLTFLFSPSALGIEGDRQQVGILDSDFAEYKNGVTRYWGNVFFQQGSLKVRAEELIAVSANGELSYLHAKGTPLHLEQLMDANKNDSNNQAQPEKLTANSTNLTYNTVKGSVHLSGDAKITKGNTHLGSDNIFYHVDQDRIEAVGNARSEQNGIRLTSHQITYDINTGRVSAAKNDQQRIRVVLPPPASK